MENKQTNINRDRCLKVADIIEEHEDRFDMEHFYDWPLWNGWEYRRES